MKHMQPVSSSLKTKASCDLDIEKDLEQPDKDIAQVIKAYEEKEKREKTQDI